uniref:UBX domain-containing protein 11 n=1 Tax=Anabas testudineus TaxID=64144 RepID=A0A3Q1JU80_ANATE
MSSPLSMLKKTKRTPLQGPLNAQWGRQRVPFRRNLLKALVDDADSSDLNTPAPTSDASTSKSKATLLKGAPPSDFELMSAMMQQVTLLERKVKIQAQEIERKDKKISVLEEKLRLRKESESTHDLSSRDSLEGRCQRLQNQVREMESFLNDYGLIWVGDGESSDSAESQPPHNAERGLWQPGTSVVRNFNMNFDLVLQRIKELNVLAGEGESFVQTTATGAQLTRKDPVQLRLYSNGIVMFDGPFRSYEDRSTQQCMQDLMDGYFPSELQERFPDGVPLEVRANFYEDFIVKRPWDKFPGEGKAVYGGRDDTANGAVSQIPGKKQTIQQFLNRLPKVVVKAGRVIDVRGSLRTTLQVGSRKKKKATSIVVAGLRIFVCASQKPSTSCDSIWTNKGETTSPGQKYFSVSFCTHSHISCLCFLHYRGGDQLEYDIVSIYPYCSYSNDCQTLQSYGLTSNAVLLLQKRQHPHSLTEVSK